MRLRIRSLALAAGLLTAAAGCRDFLVSPVTPEELRKAILNVRQVERARKLSMFARRKS